jgi:hypothetical protein
VKVVASSASLVFEQRRIHSDAVNREAIGAEWFERTLRRQRQQDAARRGHPRVAALDLSYDEVSGDWQAAIQRVYRFIGEPLTVKAMRGMERYLAGASDHRGHCYDAQDFGLDEDEIRRAFAQTPATAVHSVPVYATAHS